MSPRAAMTPPGTRTMQLQCGATLHLVDPPAITGPITIELDPDHGTELAWLLSRYQHQHAPHVITAEDAVKLAIYDAADALRAAEVSETAS